MSTSRLLHLGTALLSRPAVRDTRMASKGLGRAAPSPRKYLFVHRKELLSLQGELFLGAAVPAEAMWWCRCIDRSRGRKNPMLHGHGSQDRKAGCYPCSGCRIWPWGRQWCPPPRSPTVLGAEPGGLRCGLGK